MFANVNGKEIFFDVLGEGLNSLTSELKPKPTFVILHCASGFDHGYLRVSLDPMALLGQLVFIDLPGSGRSANTDVSAITFESMADDVAGMLDYLGLTKVFIVGHCAGGFVAQHFALRHPDRLKGLILINTSPAYTKVHDQVAPNPQLSDRAPEEVVKLCLRVYAPGVISEETLTKSLVDEMLKEVGPYFFAPHYMGLYEKVFSYSGMNVAMLDHFVTEIYPTYDLRDQLQNITAPTLIIAGSHDWLTPPSGARLTHSKISGSVYREFAESGHLTFAEKPITFFDTVKEFVESQPKKGD